MIEKNYLQLSNKNLSKNNKILKNKTSKKDFCFSLLIVLLIVIRMKKSFLLWETFIKR